MRLRLTLYIVGLILTGSLLASCDSPEQKYEKYMRRGDAYYESHDYVKARLEYRNAARITPTDPRAIYSLGLVEEAEGNLQSALSAFMTAEQQDKKFKPVLRKLAEFFLTAQQPEEARTRINALLDLEPGNPAAHALKGSLYLRNKAFGMAQQEAETALKADPKNVIAYSVLTGIQIAQKQPEKALAVLDKALSLNPKELSFYLLKATIYSEEGDITSVADTYQKIFALEPDQIRFRFDLAKILQESGHAEETEKLYQEIVHDFPDNPEAKLKLTTFLEDKKGTQAAEKEIQTFIQSAPDQKIYYLWLADLYVRNNQNDRAIDALRQVLDQNPDDWLGFNASTALAQIQLNKGDVALAERLIDAVLDKDVNNQNALFLRASLAFSQGDYQKAIIDLRSILSSDPNALRAARVLSEALLIQGHLDLAIDTILQAAQKHPDDKGAMVRLAQMRALRGDRNEARDILLNITKIDPSYPFAWESLARLAIESKQWDKAQDAIAMLEKLDGQETMTTLLKGRVKQESGQTADAIALYETVVKADPAAPMAGYALSSLLEMTAATPEQTEHLRDFLISLDAENPTILTALGNTEVTLNNLEAAESAFRTAISHAPRNQTPYLALAELLAKRNDLAGALDTLQKAQTALPSENRAAMMHAGLLEKAGRIDDAIALYEAILTRDDKVDVAANNLAQLIADSRPKDAAALERARLSAERFINSDNPLYLDTLGWVYFRQGQTTQAQTVLARAVSLLKEPNPQIAYHYGALLLKTGQPTQAQTYLQQATASPAPYSGLDEAKALLKQAQEAIKEMAPKTP